MAGKRFSLWLCILAVTLGFFRAPAALAMVLEGSRPDGEGGDGPNAYQVTLDARVIGSGETLFYETIDPEFAGNPLAEDYYPGELTVELTGQIVIEEGGRLAIGTLSPGDEKEHRPVLRGRCSPDGLIVVRAGGSLVLRNVSLDLEGEGLLIVQEPGGSVALTNMEPEEGLIAWAPPTVDNTCQQPRDLWLEEGTTLTGAMLPVTLGTYLQYQGGQRWITLDLRWDMDAYAGQTEGECTLTGTFLDEAGEALVSVRPLTLNVHWYKPGQLIVTGTAWLGQTAASAELELQELPEEAGSVWGEVSADGGKTWERWEAFQYQEEEDHVSCVFSLPDSAPRHFRVRAAGEEEHLHWASEAVLLPKEGSKPSDQGGNRGGSTAVIRPDREPSEPEPAPLPEPATGGPEPTPAESSTPEPTLPESAGPDGQMNQVPEPAVKPVPIPEITPPAAAVRPDAPADPASGSTPETAPTASVTAEPAASPRASAVPTPASEPTSTVTVGADNRLSQSPEPIPMASPTPAVQTMLVAAGVAFCGLAGVLATRRKRRS